MEGGPPVVHAILSQLKRGFPIPIIILQAFKSGTIDPICNALNKTTQLTVKPVGGSVSLLPGIAYVIPHGFRAMIEQAVGSGLPLIKPVVDDAGEDDAFLELLLSACELCGCDLKLALVGGTTELTDSVVTGLRAVDGRGGDLHVVGEQGVVVQPDVEKRIREHINIRFLTADEFVAELYRWCGFTEKSYRSI